MTKKRIIAIIVLILIGILYLATLILAFIDSPLARSFLMTALFCTIVLPAILYGYLIVSQRFNNTHKEDYDEEEP